MVKQLVTDLLEAVTRHVPDRDRHVARDNGRDGVVLDILSTSIFCRFHVSATWGGSEPEKRRIGFRWNGTDDAPISNPQSRGLPTWTMLDERMHDAIVQLLTDLGKTKEAATAKAYFES